MNIIGFLFIASIGRINSSIMDVKDNGILLALEIKRGQWE